jgi:Zn-dependent M32 family carboxypeptidase
MNAYKQHPLSAAYPEMSSNEYAALCVSVQTIGIQNPITIYQDMVLDGWNRYNAANDEAVDCPEVKLTDGVDPVHFVKAQNSHRRHLSQGQYALIEVSLNKWLENGQKQGSSVVPTELSKSSKEMALAAGVSVASIEKAKQVQRGNPIVTEAVKRGELGLEKAVAIAKLPKDQQVAAINKPLPKPILPALESDDFAPSQHELDEAIAYNQAEHDIIEKLKGEDDKFAALLKESIQIKAMNAVLESRNYGLMETIANVTALLKKKSAQLDRMEKKNKESGNV